MYILQLIRMADRSPAPDHAGIASAGFQTGQRLVQGLQGRDQRKAVRMAA